MIHTVNAFSLPVWHSVAGPVIYKLPIYWILKLNDEIYRLKKTLALVDAALLNSKSRHRPCRKERWIIKSCAISWQPQ